MLRNCAKRTLYLLVILLQGCTVRPLFDGDECSTCNIDVHAKDISIKNYFRNIIQQKIYHNTKLLNNTIIKINLSYDFDVAAFTQNGIALEDTKLIANVNLIDKNTLKVVHEFTASEYACFSVNDNTPFESISSERSALYAAIDALSTTITENIAIFIKS